jgi:serine/threonine protein kinase
MGVILFNLVAASSPFEIATCADNIFKAIWNNKPDIFWKIHSRSNPGIWNISDDLKELILMLLSTNPTHRPSIAEILHHPWWLLPWDKSDVKDEIYWKIDSNYQIPAEEEEKTEVEIKYNDIFETWTTRGKPAEKMKLDEYIDATYKTTLSKVFSSTNEEDLLWLVYRFLEDNKSLEIEVEGKTFKVAFRDKNDASNLNGHCNILSVNESVRCVVFSNLSHLGRRKFTDLFKQFKKFMGGHNDICYSSIFN